jgi:hypothetical protein
MSDAWQTGRTAAAIGERASCAAPPSTRRAAEQQARVYTLAQHSELLAANQIIGKCVQHKQVRSERARKADHPCSKQGDAPCDHAPIVWPGLNSL